MFTDNSRKTRPPSFTGLLRGDRMECDIDEDEGREEIGRRRGGGGQETSPEKYAGTPSSGE